MTDSRRILFITLRKCGSQWIRDVLSAPEIVKHSKSSYFSAPSNFDQCADLFVPVGNFSGPIYGMNAWEWQYWKSIGDRAIVVTRDPRDLLISNLFSTLYSHGSSVKIDYMRRKLHALNSDSVRIMDGMFGMSSQVRMFLTWRNHSHDDALCIRYEDLVQHELSIFGKIMRWLEWTVPEDVLNDVVTRLSFEVQSGRVRGHHDKTSHHRRGVAGDWKNYITKDLGEFWEQLYPGFLVSLGYENTNDWWRHLQSDANNSIVEINIDPQQPITSAYTEALEMRLRANERQLKEKESAIQVLYKSAQLYQMQLIEKEVVIQNLLGGQV